MTTINNTNSFLYNQYLNEISTLEKRIAYCIECIHTPGIEAWEVKEYRSCIEDNKARISEIKTILSEPVWN